MVRDQIDGPDAAYVIDGGGYERRWLALLVLCLSLVVIGMDKPS